MAKVLYITANPKEESRSYGKTIGRHFLEAYASARPDDDIFELDLYRSPVQLIDADILSAWASLQQGAAMDELTARQKQKLAALNELTAQFVGADKYVFVSPMWNLGLPPLLKAYIDAVVIQGKTYRDTPQGPVGLLQGKKGLHIHVCGRDYAGDRSRLLFSDGYLTAIMRFIGVEMHDSVIVQGTMLARDGGGEEIRRNAFRQCADAAKWLASA
jgi:FMN-dependent NADH-azoreductase